MAATPPNISNQATALKLHDIHLPTSPGVWPLAPGWWILLVLSLLLFIWISRKFLIKARQQKKQQLIFLELNKLLEKLKNAPSNETIAEINILLRRVAISVFPQQEVASLTGAKWLKLLDRSVKNSGFSKGAGRILVDAPYQSNEVTNLNLAEFIPLIRTSIKRMLKGRIKPVKAQQQIKPTKKEVLIDIEASKTGGDVS